MTLRHATRALALATLVALTPARAGAQEAGAAPDLLFQGFHWNAHPGDLATNDGGTWWDSLATVAPRLATLGVQTVWIPSPAKGAGGRFSMGYDLYDYYDLGSHYGKGTLRTRFGTRTQLEDMMAAFDASGLRTMADVVLNHRDGGDFQTDVACVPGGGAPFRKYNRFLPQSGRLPGFATHFHSNPTHCDYDGPFHDEPFGQDVCYFHDTDATLDAAAPGGGWHHGPHNLGAKGDSLVVWGRWLVDDLGVDEVRVDAIKHIETGFLAPWLSELSDGAQPFAVGEFFGGTGEIKAYHDDVEAFNGTFGGGGRAADFAVFDFGLRYALKAMADGGGFYDMSQLNTEGLLAAGLDPFSVVTFVDNHDFDRIGWQGASCSDPDAVPAGTTCVKLGTDSGHDPVVSRKMLAYAYTLAAEGRPTVWWKDVFWFGLDRDIEWLASLRRLTAQGPSTTMSGLAPNPEADQSDLFVLRRDGTGAPRYGALVAINDNDAAERGAWVNAPHADYELRDYSDRFLFETTRAYADSRAYVKAAPGDYAWYAPTGLYPRPTDEPASSFTLSAQPGGQLHHVVLRAADAADLLVDGAPIQPGDEVAVLAPDGTTAAGLGRVGQRLRWDGTHDMVIEVLGNADGTAAAGRLAEGDPLHLAVYDASEGTVARAVVTGWLAAGDALDVSLLRPTSRGGAFSLAATDADGAYTAGAVSIVTGFRASAEAGDLSVALTPHPGPVTVPAEGGPFSYTVSVTNPTDAAIAARIWAEVDASNGRRYRVNVTAGRTTVPAGSTVPVEVTQMVPARAPAGVHGYRLAAGATRREPYGVSTSISVTKAGSTAGDAAMPDAESRVGAPIEGSGPTEAAAATVRLGVTVAPNPFTGRATVRFVPSADGPARAELLDALGRRVAVLFDGDAVAGRAVSLTVDGRGLPGGVYVVRFRSADGIDVVRLVRR